jgi:peptidyl-prolyl cis-trans isomerase B (cyclophilin B)
VDYDKGLLPIHLCGSPFCCIIRKYVKKEEIFRMNKKLKSIVSLFTAVVICVFCLGGCGGSTENEETSSAQSDTNLYVQDDIKEFTDDELLTGLHHVEMQIADLGVIKLELDADQAPISVTNFVQLAESGFYDGLTFHRVLTGSLIQGGCPNGDGTGGPGYRIKGEFSENGVDNTLSHVRGAISMARTSDYDGGGCQFFIMSSDCVQYDGQYAVFGYVTEGMDIVDEICNNTPISDWNGTVEKENQPVIEKVTVID